MTRPSDFPKGTHVSWVQRIGNVERAREGVVVSHNKSGVYVETESGDVLWRTAGQLRTIEAGAAIDAIVAKHKERLVKKPDLRLVAETSEPTPQPEPTPESEAPTPVSADPDPAATSAFLAALASQGPSALEAWRTLGRQILEAKRDAVAQAELDSEIARVEVAAAEALLADARAGLARAEAQERVTRDEYAALLARMGGAL